MATAMTLGQEEIQALESKTAGISGTPTARFSQKVVEYFNRWIDANQPSLDRGQMPLDRALILLYSLSPEKDPGIDTTALDSPEKVFEASYSQCDGLTVCTENFHVMRSWIPSFKNANAALSFISENLRMEQTFALLYMSQQRICLHQEGENIVDWIAQPTEIKLNRDPDQVIDPPAIIERLGHFHKKYLEKAAGITARTLWKVHDEPKKSTLRERPEQQIQSGLLPFLGAEFRQAGAVVDEEIHINNKRVDIRIVRAGPGIPQVSTMIELKVLDPSNSQDKNLEWARSGITQADQYKVPDETDAAMACIYDARHEKTDIKPELQAYADEKIVTLLLANMEVPAPRKVKAPANTGAVSPPAAIRKKAVAKKAAPAKKATVKKRA